MSCDKKIDLVFVTKIFDPHFWRMGVQVFFCFVLSRDVFVDHDVDINDVNDFNDINDINDVDIDTTFGINVDVDDAFHDFQMKSDIWKTWTQLEVFSLLQLFNSNWKNENNNPFEIEIGWDKARA